MGVVVVSNRVARASNEPIAGGLAAALLPAVEAHGAIWVGSNGEAREPSRDHTSRDPARTENLASVEALGKGALAIVDLPLKHYRRYYEGFANSGLWPALHSRPDLIRANAEDYFSYQAVNAFMARALLRFTKADTTFWIQDYHFLTLGAELRRLGVSHPLGFFLHTPWPAREAIVGVPNHRQLVSAMLAYDLIGFQTPTDKANFIDYVTRELGVSMDGDGIKSEHGTTRIAAFPIGINVEQFATRAAKAVAGPNISRLRMSLQGATLAIGVDRIDYSKGISNRIRAFDRLLQTTPDIKREVSLLQIAVPSRSQIDTYGRLNTELAQLVGEVNGRHGEVDWTPIRYLTKGYAQSTLAGFYRCARVGLVTPLHDGMNLVAKEYVAAQNPFDPGVLVLSEFAGAAMELDAALLVNPHDIDDIAAKTAQALTMPQEERRERWEQMIGTLKGSTVHDWFADFVAALAATRSSTPAPVGVAVPAILPAPATAAPRTARRPLTSNIDRYGRQAELGN